MKYNISTGNAGEYFVAGELERRGFTVADSKLCGNLS